MVKSGDCAGDKGHAMGVRVRPEDSQYDLKSAKSMGVKKASKLFSPTRDTHRAPLYRRSV